MIWSGVWPVSSVTFATNVSCERKGVTITMRSIVPHGDEAQHGQRPEGTGGSAGPRKRHARMIATVPPAKLRAAGAEPAGRLRPRDPSPGYAIPITVPEERDHEQPERNQHCAGGPDQAERRKLQDSTHATNGEVMREVKT